ncbi:MAG: helix-turn-helix domain-containing protein [Candidatus Eremiobacteraeota bacterium]|nr:helix-turn-helix domain-containing protein [Candidatus Eremiobacteraeota bacterium]
MREADGAGGARHELAQFLASRRARLSPEAVGLAGGRRRRVAGLRREEVAVLAHVSETWYTRLERGQPINASPEVLANIADALRLDEHEREYLFLLATSAADSTRTAAVTLPGALQQLLDQLQFAPSVVYGPRWDVLMWNRAYALVFGDLRDATELERNVLHQLLLDPTRRALFPEWETIARRVVEAFRLDAARHTGDPSFAALTAYLHERSPEFRAWWSEYRVWQQPEGQKLVDHPIAGRLLLDHVAFTIPDSGDALLLTYTARPGSPTERALAELLR